MSSGTGKYERILEKCANLPPVPTAVAHHGNSYVGNLHTFPIQEGSSKILKIKPSGQVEIVVTGVTRTQDLYRAKEP